MVPKSFKILQSIITFSIINTCITATVDWNQYNHRNHLQNTYTYGYEIEDMGNNNFQFKNEKRESDGTVVGSYGYLASDGSVHLVHYIADKNGYRAKVESGVKDDHFNERGYSKQLLDVLQNIDLYRKQAVHEQRVRPFDLLSEQEKKTYSTKSK